MADGGLPHYPVPEISGNFAEQHRLVVNVGDSLEFLKTLPPNTVALVISSPPYNIGKEYEARTSIQEYLGQQQPVISELVRVLRHDGSICWEVGNYVEDGEVYPLDVYYYNIFKDRGLRLRNRIVWQFGHGLHASRRFSGRYETILWFTKGDDYIFNLDPVRVSAKYPVKREYKGHRRGKPSGNPLGKNPSDMWQFVAHEWEQEVWDIPNVKANHPEKTIHPCQFPIELAERCVLALTNESDWVLDPYCGVGSSLIAALMHNRKAMGCDKEPTYVQVAQDRIRSLFDGTLRVRPMGKPVYVPTGNDKVSQVPEEWGRRDTEGRG